MNATASITVAGVQRLVETNDRDELEIELSNADPPHPDVDEPDQVVVFIDPKDSLKTMNAVMLMLERIGIQHEIELPEAYKGFAPRLGIATGEVKRRCP